MAEEESISMTQVGAVFITSLITMMVYQITLGVFLDEWVYGVLGYLECNAWCQSQMGVVLGVVPWVWLLIKFVILFLFFWVVIMAIKKHRYTRQPDEMTSGFDMYRV